MILKDQHPTTTKKIEQEEEEEEGHQTKNCSFLQCWFLILNCGWSQCLQFHQKSPFTACFCTFCGKDSWNFQNGIPRDTRRIVRRPETPRFGKGWCFAKCCRECWMDLQHRWSGTDSIGKNGRSCITCHWNCYISSAGPAGHWSHRLDMHKRPPEDAINSERGTALSLLPIMIVQWKRVLL